MSNKLHYRTLTREDLGQMHRSFIEAFSNYQVSMKMSREAFEDRMLRKLNINFDLSPAVFSGDKLVGFIFQSINEYEGVLSAYNGGTGVIPGYLGQGLTAKLYDFILPRLKGEGVKKCVLEVLTENKQAIKSYHKSGFEISKDFQCLMLKDGVLKNTSQSDFQIEKSDGFDSNEFLALGEANASMIDQLSQVKFNLSKEIILECRSSNELLGYVIFQPHNGRISQLAVKSEYRRQGIGSLLIHETHCLSNNKKLSILNIQLKEEGLISFFKDLGFSMDLKQYEMQKLLTNV